MKTKSVKTMIQIINECLNYYHSDELPSIDLTSKSLESTHPHTFLLVLHPYDTKFAAASR